MANLQIPSPPDPQPGSYPRRLAGLLERNYAMMNRLQIGHSVLEAKVELLRGHREFDRGGKGSGHP